MIPPPAHRSAFTLVELLVAMTIASLLIAVLASALQAVSGVTQSTGGRIEAEREARATFEILERDLASAVTHRNRWIRVLEDPDPPSTGHRPLWLIFLTSPLDHDRAAPGDLCVVSYRTGHAPLPGDSDPFPSLHRLVVTAADTFEDALGQPAIDESFFAANEPADRASRDLTSWLAAGVIDIQIRGWIPGATIDLTAPDAAASLGQLTALEVTLDVLTKQGQRLYGILPPSELKARHVHRFTRKIPLPARPL